MNPKIFLLLLLLCSAMISVFGQTAPSRLTWSNPYPKPGEKLEFTYNPAGTKLETAKDISSKIYFFNEKGNMAGDDLAFKRSGNVWKAEIILPDTAVYAALQLYSDEFKDNNDTKGYHFALTDKTNKPLKGGGLAEAKLYGSFSNLVGIRTDIEKALAALEKEFALYPDTRLKNIGWYYSILTSAKKEDKKTRVKKEMLSQFNKKGAKEDELLAVLKAIDDESLADSLSKIIRIRYPKGYLVMEEKFMSFSKEKDPAKQAELYTTLKKEYGNKIPLKYNMLEDRMLSAIAGGYAEKKDYTNFKKYADQIKNKETLALTFNNTAWQLAEEGKDLDFAADLSKQSLEYVELMYTNMPVHYRPLPPSERKNQIDRAYGLYADTYAFILYKQGKTEEALKYQQKAVELYKGNYPEINERYTLLLEATGKTKEALEKIETYIKNGRATVKMKDQLKALYSKEKGSEQGYEDYVASLEAQAKEKMRQEIIAQMINDKAPAFSLKDTEGKPVSLADLKGKVVVIDFWATWCRPCLASFPGMQKAVTKYQDNPDVKFVFINTRETGEKRLEKVKNLIEKNKYTFHVLMDEEKEGKHVTANAFEVQGIPVKFVIDKNGMTRFKKLGFSGDTDETAEEVSIMIDTLLKNPSDTPK
ncbi:MAG: redoxin domain-containing protein [Daejeonella sp.]